MNTTNHGGPAFPTSDAQVAHLIATAAIDGIEDPAERDRVYTAARAEAQYGMTLRDYFAAKAMQGFCAHAVAGMEWSSLEIARAAYAQADAMLAARGAA